jgi:hypothetical protein
MKQKQNKYNTTLVRRKTDKKIVMIIIVFTSRIITFTLSLNNFSSL